MGSAGKPGSRARGADPAPGGGVGGRGGAGAVGAAAAGGDVGARPAHLPFDALRGAVHLAVALSGPGMPGDAAAVTVTVAKSGGSYSPARIEIERDSGRADVFVELHGSWFEALRCSGRGKGGR